MAAQLPTFPRVVFTVFEPITLISGCLPALFAPDWFIGEQLAEAIPSSAAASDHSRLVAQQLGNAYGLLFMVGVAVLYTSTEAKVVRNYLVALLVADVGHVGLTIVTLGRDRFLDLAAWNAMTWGNIGITLTRQTFLALTRISYLLGLFGPNKPAPVAAADKTK